MTADVEALHSRVARRGADRVVLTLADSAVGPRELAAALRRHPIVGLCEVLVIDRHGNVVHLDGAGRVVASVSGDGPGRTPRREHPTARPGTATGRHRIPAVAVGATVPGTVRRPRRRRIHRSSPRVDCTRR